ncbi:MAG: TolB family protein [Bryobacteraceae bacterium]
MSPQTGEKRRLTSVPNGYLGDIALTFSPDGKTLAFIRMRNLGIMAIYLLSLSSSGSAEGEAQRLTPDQAWIGGFDFTPDGRTIVFSSGQYANPANTPTQTCGQFRRMEESRSAWSAARTLQVSRSPAQAIV